MRECGGGGGQRFWFPPTLLVLFHAQQGVEDAKQHKWFKAVDWDAVLQRKLVVSGEECGDRGGKWEGGVWGYR